MTDTETRPARILRSLEAAGENGATTNDFIFANDGWTYPQTSGALSRMHKRGQIVALTERREGQRVYVLPTYVGDRETLDHRATHASTAIATGQAAPAADPAGLMAMAAVMAREVAKEVLGAVVVAKDTVSADDFAALQAQADALAVQRDAAVKDAQEARAGAEKTLTGRAVAKSLREAAEGQWNAQAKVALLDLADEWDKRK